nr:hypothetical protein [Tanacetum cinerariifolium]
MSSAFADTHNMVSILTKSDFWNTVTVKHSADVTRLQALVDKKKVMISEAVIRDVLRLDDVEGVDCLPNDEIFTGLARMGYEKPSTKLTFYKAFFSSQWKFLIHTILQSLSAKRTSWNKFSSVMESAVICLSTGRKFNFSKYIFDSLVRNVDSSSKLYMYPRFIQLIIQTELGDLSTHTTKYISPALTQKVFANMRRIGKGFSGYETPLFEGMLVVQENVVEGIADEQVQADAAIPTAPENVTATVEEDIQAQTISSSSPPPQDLPFTSHFHPLDTCAALTSRIEQLESDILSQALEITQLTKRVKRLKKGQKVKVFRLRRLKKVGTSQSVETLDDTLMEDVSNQGRIIDELDRDEAIELMGEKEEKKKDIANDDQAEGRHAEIQSKKQAKIYQIDMDHAVKVLKVVTAASAPVSVASIIIPAAEPNIPAVTITAPPVKVVASSTRQRRRVVIRDPKEVSSAKTSDEIKSNDKGKGILVEESKPMKKKQQVEMDEAYARKLHEELNQDIDWDVAIEHNTAGFKLDYFKGKSYDDIRPIFEAKFNTNMECLLKSKEKIEEEESRALESINETPAQKAVKRRRLNKEDKDVEEIKQHLEIVPDEDDDIYTKATPLARKVPVVDYQIILLNNKPRHKIIKADETHQLYASFITLILLVERRYPLSRFTLDQMLNVVRLQVEEQSEMSIKRIRSLKKNTKCVNAAGEELSAVKHKLMLLDTAAERKSEFSSAFIAMNSSNSAKISFSRKCEEMVVPRLKETLLSSSISRITKSAGKVNLPTSMSIFLAIPKGYWNDLLANLMLILVDYDHGNFGAFISYEAKHWLEIHFNVERKLKFLGGVGQKELGERIG